MGEWFQRIRDATAYMSDIITAIKGQAATVNLSESTSFTISELVERSRLLMRHELQSGNCTLEVEGEDENRDFTLHGDINNLVQVLNNLLSNAVYAQKQSGGGVITIGVKQDGDDLKIYVKDTGSGVKPQVKKRLFKEMITSKGTMGTGLGLYISIPWSAENSAAACGWRTIRAAARFSACRSRCAQFRWHQSNDKGEQAMRKHQKVADVVSSYSILALDDDPTMTLTLQTYFQRSGYHVDTENDPYQAIERVRNGHYDILLLDF